MTHHPRRTTSSSPGPDWAVPKIGQPPPRGRALVWFVMLLSMALWSLLATLAYMIADPVLAWLAPGVGGLVEGGQNAAEAFAGKPAGEALKSLDVSGIATQLFGFLRLVAKPVIVGLWAIGMLALMAGPALASAARRLMRSRH